MTFATLAANARTFAADEQGAVTVDWVVLTAALVGLGLAVMTVVNTGITNLSGDIEGVLCADIVNGAGVAANATAAPTGTC